MLGMYYELLMILIVFRFYVDSLESNKSDAKLKIIGGLTVKNRSDFSYQVSLRYAGHHLCGGSIISESLILTAAHCCFHDKKPLSRHNLMVVAGDLNIRKSSNKTESRTVSAVYVHPSYDDKSIKNDIALWKVSTPFIWGENIQPVEISNYKVRPNSRCNVSGWGVTDHELNVVSSNLKYVEVPIIAKSFCRKIYPEIISLKVICAGSYGRDSCQGDSGGGLVCNRTLAGIVSFGEGCGVNPGVYTDVYAYRSWIKFSMRTINSGLHEVPNNIFILFVQVSIIFSGIIP